MNWLALLIAGLLEILWAVGLKFTDGYTKLWPTTFTLVTMILSCWFLNYAMKEIPLGTAYAVWTGIGIIGTAIIGIIWFGESAEFLRLVCMGLILIGILGLKILHV